MVGWNFWGECIEISISIFWASLRYLETLEEPKYRFKKCIRGNSYENQTSSLAGVGLNQKRFRHHWFFSNIGSGSTNFVRSPMPKLWTSIRLRCRCHETQIAKTNTVSGMVIVGKSHHCRPMVSDSIPFSLVVVLKNTILKRACIHDSFVNLRFKIWLGSVLTETKVPGRKNIVTAAILKIGVTYIINIMNSHGRRRVRTLSSKSCHVEWTRRFWTKVVQFPS